MYIGQVDNKWNVIGHASEAGSKRQAPKIKIFSLDSCRVSRNKMYERFRQLHVMITLHKIFEKYFLDRNVLSFKLFVFRKN
jgi:hypothetical protein